MEREAALLWVSSFFDVEMEFLLEEIERRERYFDNRILLSDELSEKEIEEIEASAFSGVLVEEGYLRSYRDPYRFSHVLGYTSLVSPEDLERDSSLLPQDQIGRDGVEAFYDNLLHGQNGLELYVRDSVGNVEEKRLFTEPEAGLKLTTYIDAEFQEYFYNRMREGLRSLDRTVGVGIALNPQNGEVLALFGVPGYDVEDVGAYLYHPDRPLFNRPISGLYSPGSTIKPLHALAALRDGIVTEDTRIFSAGTLEVPNPFDPEHPSIFKDWKAHGWVDARSALARSSNIYFYEVGGGFEERKGLGISRILNWWKKFLFDEKTGIDLVGEESGFLPTPEWKEETLGRPWLVGDTYNISIGQGDFLITPLQLLSYIGVIANGGRMYRPRVVSEAIRKDGAIVEQNTPEMLFELDEASRGLIPIVEEGMVDAVLKPYGTARMLSDLPYVVAGKTGSAQTHNNQKLNAFFVGYGPLTSPNSESVTNKRISESTNGQTQTPQPVQPELAVLVLIEDAREGSLNAVPIARDVFLWYYENRVQARTNAELDAD